MTDLLAVAVALVLAGVIGWRAADDQTAPKVLLVRSEWACRQSHAEFDAVPRQDPDGSIGRDIRPVMVCDIWSRR